MDKTDLSTAVGKLWKHRKNKRIHPGTWSFVFFFLMSMILLYPYFESLVPERPALTLFIINFIVMSAIIWEVSTRPIEIFLGLFIGMPALILHWLPPSKIILVTEFSLTLSLYFYAMLLIVVRVAQSRSITLEHIFGTATLYLLMGLFWTDAYLLIETITPLSFAYQSNPFHPTWMDTLYYSFTTLTTLGYGDITPMSPHARSISILESVTGVLFNVIVLGRIIGIYVQTLDQGKIENV